MASKAADLIHIKVAVQDDRARRILASRRDRSPRVFAPIDACQALAMPLPYLMGIRDALP
jgi:hypothetical protein